MGAVKNFSLCLLSFALFAQVAQADPIPWTWWLSTNPNFAPALSNNTTHNALTAFSAYTAQATSSQQAAAAPAPVTAPAPAPVQAPATFSAAETVSAPAPTISAASVAPAAGSSSTPADAYINFGSGPYPDANLITTSTPQPWYNSPQITNLFGGQPTSQQQADFAKAVLQDVQQTFQQSGVPVNLTTNPNVAAAHTLSLVSNTNAKLDGTAIGMTEVGGSGFSFINNIAPSAQNLTQLQLITAHNISHELMLAFGVTENYDTTGNYIDARNANWSMMTDPNAAFSPAAAQALLSKNFQSNIDYSTQGAQVIDPQQVPEPTTIAFWVLAGTAAIISQRKRSRQASAA